MMPASHRVKIIAPLLALSVLIYLAHDALSSLISFSDTDAQSSTYTHHPQAFIADANLDATKASIQLSSILNLIASTVNASIDRFDEHQAHDEMRFELARTYPAGYNAHLRQAHAEFFHTDAEILNLALSHLSRVPQPLASVGKRIFMTGMEEREGLPEECDSWTRMNPGWEGVYVSDSEIDMWLAEVFPEVGGVQAGVVKEMRALKGKRGIIRSDMFRYLALLLEGGLYSDTDTKCVVPIDQWAPNPEKHYAHPLEQYLPELFALASPSSSSPSHGVPEPSSLSPHEAPPSLVVAIEMDAHGTDWDWRGYHYARGIQICQWTILAGKGHPVLLDTLSYALAQAKTIRLAEEAGEQVEDPKVLDWSGPGPFSDALMRYLLVKYGVHPTDLAGMRGPRRYGDVLILPMHAFRAEEVTDQKNGRVVYHGFYGRWKNEENWK